MSQETRSQKVREYDLLLEDLGRQHRWLGIRLLLSTLIGHVRAIDKLSVEMVRVQDLIKATVEGRIRVLITKDEVEDHG